MPLSHLPISLYSTHRYFLLLDIRFLLPQVFLLSFMRPSLLSAPPFISEDLGAFHPSLSPYRRHFPLGLVGLFASPFLFAVW